ncbi:PepSY domain-containing protein [Marinobacterium marinum]|uniref:NADPH--hemoprotein reductase n=1 Tax=Marinobacterium marinum TaxID=2756129 RepID=A0A7W2AB61_9GAMM|nr:PepSY domain-containing protein [Marinobacterium marinum]MBA4501735.1 PepSY domain-containing protein [Marinobacterium marinum]
MRAYLLQVHRWLALLLTPVFLLITLTGMVLAFKPIMADLSAPPYAGAVDTARLTSMLERVPSAESITALERSSVSGQWIVPGVGEYRVGDAVRVGDVPVDASADFFAWVKDLHKRLLLDMGWLVEWVTYAMVAIMVVGVLLGWPKFSRSLIGWHQWLGAWLLPVAIMLPLTGVLMSLHIGRPDLGLQKGVGATPLVQGIQQAADRHDISAMTSARRFKSGSVLIQTPDQAWVVSGTQVTPVDLASNLPKQLHEGLWAGWVSGVFNILTGGLVAGLTLTGGLSWLRRQRAAGARQTQADAQVLVVFASQTGTGQGLAAATAAALQRAGIAADQGAITAFGPADWQRYRQVLVIASTTGEGELPDMARSWVKHLKTAALKGAGFSLLALGDRRYVNFCAGGCQLRQALLEAGAVEQLPMHEVDGDPAADWNQWLQKLSEHHGWTLAAERLTVQRQRCQARLVERVRLDLPMDEHSPQSYSLILEVPESTTFAPGDLFQFQPRAGAEPRTYSVGSAADVSPGRVRLTVGLLKYTDDQGDEVLGLGSGELCLRWPLGETREVELVAHPGFNPPANTRQPLIMVATGCGIAPFIGFLETREAAGDTGPVWLLFGNRYHEGDYLYREQIQSLAERQVITDLDTVFSRDGGTQRYITERLEQEGDKLLDWMAQGAVLYICGRASTLGKGIDRLLLNLLQKRGKSLDEAQAELVRWADQGMMRRDLFD